MDWPAREAKVRSVTHGGMRSGPRTAVDSATPSGELATTRQNSCAPGAAPKGSVSEDVAIVVSRTRVRSAVSLPTLRRNRCGPVPGIGVPASHAKLGVTVSTAFEETPSGVTPEGKAYSLNASGMPQPWSLSGSSAKLPAARSPWRSSSAGRPARAPCTSAASPATSGVANEVPLLWVIPRSMAATVTASPGATSSGLMRPSAVGPRELKPTTRRSESVAPIARAESASAGVPRVRGCGPSFPTEMTTSVPRCAALSAAMVVTATSPFSCADW